MDIARIRSETPGCSHTLHLDAAGSSLVPQAVIDAISSHLELEARVGGYDAAEQRVGDIGAAYAAVATLLSTAPRNIAFMESATIAYAAAISSLPFERGDVVLTTRDDYISNQLFFLSLAKRFQIEIERAPNLESGGVDPDAMGRLIEERRPRLVAVTHVPTNSGLVQPVAEIGRYCHEHGVIYLVDACQSVGQLEVDVGAIGCDFLSATARKFLRGPRGSGFLFVSDRVLDLGLEPLFIDMRGARWTGTDAYQAFANARRFESWEFAYALLLGTGAGARYALELGMPAIEVRLRALASRLRAGLEDIEGVRVLDRGLAPSAIVSAAIPGWEPQRLKHALRARGVIANVSLHEYARLDLEDKGVQWTLRVSPHYYNTEDELDRFVRLLARLVDQRRT